MDLMIERSARKVENRYRLRRDFDISRDYSAPKTLQSIESMSLQGAVQIKDQYTIRLLEQDRKTEAKMDHKTAQFFLRNLPKAVMEPHDADEMPFEGCENVRPEPVTFRHVSLRPRFIRHWSVNDFRWLQDVLRKTLCDENWTDRFSKEIRDTLMKGLWTSNPDPLNVYRHDFPKDESVI